MEAAADFLIKQRVLHRVQHIRIDADGKFAEIARALIGIQQCVDACGVVGGRLDDLAVLDLETDIFVGEALFLAEGIVGDHAVHRFFDRSGVDFAVRNVAASVAFDCRNALDGEGQIGVRTDQTHLVCALHEINQRIHSAAHFVVVQCADIEEKVFEGFLRFVCELCHRRVRIAQHDPFGAVDAPVQCRRGQPFIHI